MLRRVVLIVSVVSLVACIALPTLADRPAAQWNAEGTVLTVAAPARAPAAPAEVAAAEAPEGPRDRLGLLQRRRLGLTVAAVAEAHRAAVADGEIDEDMPASVRSIVVAERLVAANPQGYAAEAGRDWAEFFEQLLAFIEKLLPIIMLFFA